MKRFLCISLTILLTVGFFSSCQKKKVDSVSKDDDKKIETTKEPEKEEKLSGSLLSKEPVTFTLFLVNMGGNRVYNSEWLSWKEIAKRTNVKLEGVVPLSNSDRKSAFNMMMSSGELADIIAWNDAAQLESLGRDGGLIPLNDLINKYAPNIKKYLDSDPRYSQVAYSLDGNIYQIPRIQELFAAEYWWIRQDWLDKLNLKVPTNVDELYKVLTAFRNDDPNGNGKKDEIPLFDRGGHKMPDEYLYLWDTSAGFYVEDGKMVFEPMEEDYKTGVTNLVKWYKEGLIDPEIFTRGASARDTLLAGNLGGLTHDWVSTGNYNKSLAKDVPGFQIVPMAPPANQHGKVKERTCRLPNIGWGISSQCKDPETVMKFFNYIYGEEGTALVNYGIEGDSYTINSDGTIKYSDEVLNAEEGALNFLANKYGINADIGRIEPAAYEYGFMNEDGERATKLYNDHPEWYDMSAPPFRDGKMNLKISPEDEDEYLKIMSNVDSYVAEKFQGWLLGTSNFESDYEDFISELEKRGIKKAIEIAQKSYDLQY